MGYGAASRVGTHHFIQRGIQLARIELLAILHFFAASPPVGIAFVKDVLIGRLGSALVGGGLAGFLRRYAFFEEDDPSSPSSDSES
ncbi:hypothetical protein SDC9_113617 [bioreactor metagenome]|uniref:Uncharacterized protein n=1 Tax=bioreactor metagenome TaxID=1076179 RepID=A0A645BMW4_9ZZZZ